MNNIGKTVSEGLCPKKTTSIVTYLHHYTEYLRVKAYSPLTIESHNRMLSRFLEWCEQHGIGEPKAITRDVIVSYQRKLFYYRKDNGKPLKQITQNQIVVTIKMFCKWLVLENHIRYSPAETVELARLPRQLPRSIINKKDIQRLMQTPNIATALGIRDRAILETLYSTAMRRMEIEKLQIQDVDVDAGIVTIRQGKGGHQRLVPIANKALEWINKYLSHVRPLYELDISDNTLFLYENGEPLFKSRLSALVKRYMKKADINKEGSCHLLRHVIFPR